MNSETIKINAAIISNLEYATFSRAAELLGCHISDLAHWASQGKISLYVYCNKVTADIYITRENRAETLESLIAGDLIHLPLWNAWFDEYTLDFTKAERSSSGEILRFVIDVYGLWQIERTEISDLFWYGGGIVRQYTYSARAKVLNEGAEDYLTAILRASERDQDLAPYISGDDMRRLHRALHAGERLTSTKEEGAGSSNDGLNVDPDTQQMIEWVRVKFWQDGTKTKAELIRDEIVKRFGVSRRKATQVEQMAAPKDRKPPS